MQFLIAGRRGPPTPAGGLKLIATDVSILHG